MTNTSLKQWIATSLQNGHQIAKLQDILIKTGFTKEEVEKELANSVAYLEILDKMHAKLFRREALLKTLDYHLRGLPTYLKAEKVKLPPFKQFLEEYYYPNRFGVFSNVLDNCEAKHWTPATLLDKVGADTTVQMQYGKGNDVFDMYGKDIKPIKFGDFISAMGGAIPAEYLYITANNYDFNHSVFAPLRKEIEDIGDGYFAPEDTDRNKQAFYIGPKDTVSMLHYDVLDILLIQVYGRKHIRLIPAMQVPYMYNNKHPRSCDFGTWGPNLEQYPDFSNVTPIEVEIGPGDALFIPVGWWHHITSLSATISVSCANLKGSNASHATLTQIL